MNDTDARRRNHWVSHIARHAHEIAYILTDSGASLLIVEEATASCSASRHWSSA